MPKRSSKRRLNGEKLRRYNLYLRPEVGDMLEDLAGDVSYSVAAEEVIKFVYRRKLKKENAPSPQYSPLVSHGEVA